RLAARPEAASALAYRPGVNAHGAVRCPARRQHLRRSAALVRATDVAIYRAVVSGLLEVPAVAAVCADDARSGDPGAGLAGRWDRRDRPAARRVRPRAALLLPLAPAGDPYGRPAAGLLATRRDRLSVQSPTLHAPRRTAGRVRLRLADGL